MTLFNPDHLNLYQIRIQSGDQFSREASLEDKNGGLLCRTVLRRIPKENRVLEDLSLTFTLSASDGYSDEFYLTLRNYNDEPVRITSIEADYKTQDIIFKPRTGKQYFLIYGDRSLSAPVYDLQTMKESMNKVSAGHAELGGVQSLQSENKPEKTSKTVNYRLIFQVIMVIVSIVLTLFLIVMIFVKKREDHNEKT
jgi:hypothetical protein